MMWKVSEMLVDLLQSDSYGKVPTSRKQGENCLVCVTLNYALSDLISTFIIQRQIQMDSVRSTLRTLKTCVDSQRDS
jgi:hypothetical protein